MRFLAVLIAIPILIVAMYKLTFAQYDFDKLSGAKGSNKVVKNGNGVIEKKDIKAVHEKNTSKSEKKQEQIRSAWIPTGGKRTPDNADVIRANVDSMDKGIFNTFSYEVTCSYRDGSTGIASFFGSEKEGFSWYNAGCQGNKIMGAKRVGTYQQALHNACACVPNY